MYRLSIFLVLKKAIYFILELILLFNEINLYYPDFSVLGQETLIKGGYSISQNQFTRDV